MAVWQVLLVWVWCNCFVLSVLLAASLYAVHPERNAE